MESVLSSIHCINNGATVRVEVGELVRRQEDGSHGRALQHKELKRLLSEVAKMNDMESLRILYNLPSLSSGLHEYYECFGGGGW